MLKARLVAQGYQARGVHIRSDAPTGSADAVMFARAFSAQTGWTFRTSGAKSAYLQAEGITRLRLIRMPAWTEAQSSLLCPTLDVLHHGCRTCVVLPSEELSKYLATVGIVESSIEKGFYRFAPNGGPNCHHPQPRG